MKKRHYIAPIIIICVLIVISIVIFYKPNHVQDMNYTDFIDKLESGKVSVIHIEDETTLKISLNTGEIFHVPNPQKENMREYFLLNGASVVEGGKLDNTILSTVGVVFALVVLVYFLKKSRQKDKLEVVNANGQMAQRDTCYNFNSIAGNDEAKDSVKDIIDFIKNPKKYSRLGAKMPKGILLYGPPGTGKTLMAKAIAGESGVPFYAVSGSDFVQMYVGVGASRIRQLFNKAKKSKKAVIFIDEIDAIGKKRASSALQGSDERDQTLNALLTEMSGFEETQGIVVIAATNRLDTLDEALLRPGRFDRLIEIGLPDINARKRILNLHFDNKPVDKNVDIEKIALETVYFSGAMLENLVNEAAIIAANENSDKIYQNHVEIAYYNVLVGSAKKDLSSISKEDKKVTAYHESGHALVTKLLLPENKVSKVTIIPSSKGYGGFSMNIPKDRMYKTKNEILSDIKVLLAGRAAEELIFGENNITTGASNDIEKASKLVKEYIIRYGMDRELGLFNCEAAGINLGEDVVIRCRNKMKALYDETKELLESNLYLLNSLAKVLIEKETIGESDIEEVLSKSKIA